MLSSQPLGSQILKFPPCSAWSEMDHFRQLQPEFRKSPYTTLISMKKWWGGAGSSSLHEVEIGLRGRSRICFSIRIFRFNKGKPRRRREKSHAIWRKKYATGDKFKWLDDYNLHRNCRVVKMTLIVTGYSGVATFLSTLGLEEWISLFEEERIDVRFGKWRIF